MTDFKLMNIYELEEFVTKRMTKNEKGILFCFGTSFISRIIIAKTRLDKNELVPSHVALLTKDFIYESTTDEEKIGYKKIKQGVRRWLTKDFLNAEKSKLTKYVYIPHEWSTSIAENYVHYPYGKDTILDFLLKDGSEGESHGLICSQYANMCIKYKSKKNCPTPVDLFRLEQKRLDINILE